MTVKFAIVGCGRILKKHLEAIRDIEKAELTAVCDIVKEKAQKAGTEAGVPWYTDYNEMLSKHPQADVVTILTPSGMHPLHVVDIVKKFKKHIVCEKPMALKLEDADQMTVQAANAFLKTLEEPPTDSVIILTTSKPNSLVPTILSRCQPVYFKPLSQGVIRDILYERFSVDTVMAKSAARISGGNLKTAIRIAQDSTNTTRQRAFELLDLARRNASLDYLSSFAANQVVSDALKDLIAYIGVIVNDLAIVPFAPQEITNLDKVELLSELAHEALAEKIPDFLLLLDDYSHKLEGNVNAGLLQLNLYLALRNLLRQK